MLGVSRSGYYIWYTRTKSNRSHENHRLITKIRAIYKKSRENYGSPRVYEALKADGEICSKKRVERFMSANGIQAKHKRKYIITTDSRHNMPVAENILNREFAVKETNRVWANDITYIQTEEGFLYLAGILDLCSKKVIVWSMSQSLDRTVVMDALKMAYRRRRPFEGLIHHSDRGNQYANEDYRNLLKEYDMQMSMSRKGNCSR